MLSLPQDSSALELIEAESFDQPIAFFKHSPRCGVSLMVRRQFLREVDGAETSMPIYEIDVLSQRSDSQLLAQVTSVRHESPQLLVVYKGKVCYHESHHGISFGDAVAAVR